MRRVEIDNKEDWLKVRRSQGIGGSEASAIVGMSKYKTATELFLEKKGITSQKDISGLDVVKRGVAYEPVLRQMYQTAHPKDKVSYHPYDVLFQENVPWLFATLDGEIERGEKKGVLEIKTATISNLTALSAWDKKVPDGYFCQILHQMLATGFDFAVLYAALFMWDGSIQIREYEFTREECDADMNWLYVQESDFYNDLKVGRMPKLKMNF